MARRHKEKLDDPIQYTGLVRWCLAADAEKCGIPLERVEWLMVEQCLISSMHLAAAIREEALDAHSVASQAEIVAAGYTASRILCLTIGDEEGKREWREYFDK